MKLTYAVVYEQTPNNFCAYVPDLPGCVSTGQTWDDVQEMMREAIKFHLEGILESGEAVPQPRMSLEQAEAQHNEPLSEEELETLAPYEEDKSCLPTAFGLIEVEVRLFATVMTS